MNNLGNYGAGILVAGRTLASRIPAGIGNERATPPVTKNTSRKAPFIPWRIRTGRVLADATNALRLLGGLMPPRIGTALSHRSHK